MSQELVLHDADYGAGARKLPNEDGRFQATFGDRRGAVRLVGRRVALKSTGDQHEIRSADRDSYPGEQVTDLGRILARKDPERVRHHQQGPATNAATPNRSSFNWLTERPYRVLGFFIAVGVGYLILVTLLSAWTAVVYAGVLAASGFLFGVATAKRRRGRQRPPSG
jgi:hypothetical protein